MDVDLFLSELSYETENYLIKNSKSHSVDFIQLPEEKQKFFEYLKGKGYAVPETIDLIGANYDSSSGTTVIVSRNTSTGEVLASCTGTNGGAGWKESIKDVSNWLDIAMFGIDPYGQEANSIIDFFEKLGVYPDRISGHSLGGCIAQLVGIRLNIDIVTFNSAPLYTILSNLVALNTLRLSKKKLKQYKRNTDNMNNLKSKYTAKMINYYNDNDMMTFVNKWSGGQTIGKSIEVSANDDDGLTAHSLSAFKNHPGFIDDNGLIVKHNLQELQGYVTNSVFNIDINNDQLIDIVRTKQNFIKRELLRGPENWYTQGPGVIEINPDDLQNLYYSLNKIKDEFVVEEKSILSMIQEKNELINANKINRIQSNGEEIKNTILNDYLNKALQKVAEIVSVDITISGFDIDNLIKALDWTPLDSSWYTIEEYNVQAEANRLCVSIKSRYEKLLDTRNKCVKLISDFNTNLDNIFESLSTMLSTASSKISNDLDDYVCSMFKRLVEYLSEDIDKIELFLNKGAELTKIIKDQFEEKDEAEARAIRMNFLLELTSQRIDAGLFKGLERANKKSVKQYNEFYNFDHEFEKHINECFEGFEKSYIKPMKSILSDLLHYVMYIEEYDVVSIVNDIDKLLYTLNQEFYSYTIERQGTEKTTLNKKYLNEEFGYDAYDSSNPTARGLFTLKQIIPSLGYDSLCFLAQQLNMGINDEGLYSYLWNMITQAFYQTLDYDEQKASLSIMCLDLDALSRDIISVCNILERQSSKAISDLGELLKEISDYCVVFQTRVSMVFNYTNN